MSIEEYGWRYVADTDEARQKIQGLIGTVRELGNHQIATVTGFEELARATRTIAGNLPQLSRTVDDLGKAKGPEVLFNAFTRLNDRVLMVNRSVTRLGTTLNDLDKANKGMVGLENSLLGFTRTVRAGSDALKDMGREAGNLRGKRADVDALTKGVEGVQRKAYGAFKNIEDMGKGLSALPAKGAGLGSISASLSDIRGKMRGTAASARGFGRALDSWAAKLAGIRAVQQEIARIGEASNDARQVLNDGGRNNLKTRDSYRELANLLGRAEPDNGIVAGAMRVRVATGLDDKDTNDALRRFQGGLGAAVDRGNIKGDALTGVAGDFLRESLRTGLRVQVNGSTSALLAAKLAQQQAIPDAATGVGEIGTILDTLNRGDGDLDPLVSSLIRGSGGYVGQGRAFPNLKEFAAAQSTASLNASPTVSATRVQQAFAGMQQVMAEDSTIKEGGLAGMVRRLKGGKRTDTLDLSPTDFVGNIDKLATVVQGKENQDAALEELGIGNRASRRSILQFITNRDVLKNETNAVRKGVTGQQVVGLNNAFFKSDDAQARIASAEIDATKFAQFASQEPVAVLRDKAEASLRRKGELDNPASIMEDAGADSVFTRATVSAARLFGGLGVNQETLPLFMGGKPTRQIRLDKEAERIAREQAERVGVDPGEAVRRQFGGIEPSREDRLSTIAGATREKGGAPFGGSGNTDALLRALVEESKRTREAIERGNKPVVPLLPQARVAPVQRQPNNPLF